MSTPAPLSTFAFAPAGIASPGLTLRVVDREGAPWFVAKDVCEALGMGTDAKHGTADWLRGLEEDEVIPAQSAGIKLPGTGMHNAKLVSESGLYSLILKSRKPEAKAFKKWVTSVVLPAIRKDGAYVMGEALPNIRKTPPRGPAWAPQVDHLMH